MPASTLGDLLDRCTEFEQRLEEFYAEIRDASKDNSVRLLTYYLNRHRWHIPGALSERTTAVLQEIRDLPMPDGPADPTESFGLLATPVPEITGKALLNAAINYDSALLDLYSHVRKQKTSEDCKEVMQKLIKSEKKEIGMLKKMLEMHYF